MLDRFLEGYKRFRLQYASNQMPMLAQEGQNPEVMIVSCCDSRVDPAIILQCQPGDLFVVRNVASIIPPYEKDNRYHGTSAALEFGIRFLKVKHLIILGHSQCGGIQSFLSGNPAYENDFINKWVSIANHRPEDIDDVDTCTQKLIRQSYMHCFDFPWLKKRFDKGELSIHKWFFAIKTAQLFEVTDSAMQEIF